LVQLFVARKDKDAEQKILTDPPANECERSEMQENIGIGLNILQDRDVPADRCMSPHKSRRSAA
jgi:hypothetical protein